MAALARTSGDFEDRQLSRAAAQRASPACATSAASARCASAAKKLSRPEMDTWWGRQLGFIRLGKQSCSWLGVQWGQDCVPDTQTERRGLIFTCGWLAAPAQRA